MTAIAPEAIDIKALPHLPLSHRKHLPNCAGIYFVLEGENVVYVGQASSLVIRWLNHNKLKQLRDRRTHIEIAWLECSDRLRLNEIEQALIEWFQPELNQVKRQQLTSYQNRTIYDKPKKRYQFMLTKTASNELDEIADNLSISRSELLERFIRLGGLKLLSCSHSIDWVKEAIVSAAIDRIGT